MLWFCVLYGVVSLNTVELLLFMTSQLWLFIALIHPIQWTIAKPVGADRPAKRQKKTSCVSTGWPVPVLCIRQVAHGIYFLSRQHDVIASFSFGACTVQTCFQQSPDILRKVCIMMDFIPFLQIFYCKSVTYVSSTDIHREICWKRSLADSI